RTLNTANHPAHRPAHSTQPNHIVPVATIPRNARPLNTEYGTYFAATYIRSQALESRAIDQTRTRASQIVVDDHDLLETQRACSIGEATLQARAFLVVN